MDKGKFGEVLCWVSVLRCSFRLLYRARVRRVFVRLFCGVVVSMGLFVEVQSATVPGPAEYFGYEVGERHLTHAEIYGYLRVLAESSERMRLVEYGESHGHRKLVQLVVSASENMDRLETMREAHLETLSGERSVNVRSDELPLVISFYYGIHGNEPSASNAAVEVAYYLASSDDPLLVDLLKSSVILLDPILNPDGFDRFAHWANAYVGRNANPDPNTLEHNEAWPYGRTNYYWFDLNRDWMLLTQPESRGRMELYQKWLPHLVLDFHEMGTDSTYFFQPGVPERTHPLISDATYALTERVSDYLAEAFDGAGALYFTKERFDDFYPGKGSTVSDLKGAVGILFEQGSARGMIQKSENGPVSFRTAIDQQVLASMAALRAASGLRDELIAHTRNFYVESMQMAKEAGFAGYAFSAASDPARAAALAEVLRGHAIELWQTPAFGEWFVPLEQPQYRYLEALFEARTEFEQNLFYDITAWTLPLAYNVKVRRESVRPQRHDGQRSDPGFAPSELGYVIDWASLEAPRLVLDLLEEEVLLKVAKEPFTLEGESFGYGAVFVPVSLQAEKSSRIDEMLSFAEASGVRVVSVGTFRTEGGVDLGSNSFFRLEKPSILVLADAPLNPYETGTVWHLLDVQTDYPVTMVRRSQLDRIDLSEYTALVLPSTWGAAYDARLAERLGPWVRAGGTLVCLGNAANWAIEQKLVQTIALKTEAAESEQSAESEPERRPFAAAADDRALERIRGAIFKALVDGSHPLAYGITEPELPVFVERETFMAPSTNVYQTPIVFAENPLLSGYASEKRLEELAGAAALVAEPVGSGAVVLFGHSPTFRAYWRGTDKLLLNALLFGREFKP